jgi:hypothetical protein
MLGDESEPVNELDPDIADAISEFVSNLSGSLTTAINGSALEDLGQSKFTLGVNEILDTVENFDNTYKFSINLEGNYIKLFAQLDDPILPYFEEISNSPESVYEDSLNIKKISDEEKSEDADNEEEETKEETTDIQEVIEETTSSPTNEEAIAKEEAFGDAQNVDVQNDTPEQSTETKDKPAKDVEDTEEESDKVKEKTKKLKIVIIIIASLLILTIIAALTMFFTGMFDPEPIKEDQNTTKMVKTKDNLDVIKYSKVKTTDFNPSDVNEKKLNSQLSALTKHSVLSESEIEEQALAEKERQYQLQKQLELEEFAAQNKEEDIFTKHEEEKEIVVDKKTTFSNETFEETSKKPETKDEDTRSTINKILNSSSDNSDKYKLTKVMTTGIGSENAEGNPNAEKFMQGMQEQREKNEKKRPLKFILVESLKYRLYKKLIAKVNTAQAKISICNNDKGRTSIYLGPFNKKSKQQQMIDMLLENDITEASTITLTKEEFDSRCNF